MGLVFWFDLMRFDVALDWWFSQRALLVYKLLFLPSKLSGIQYIFLPFMKISYLLHTMLAWCQDTKRPETS